MKLTSEGCLGHPRVTNHPSFLKTKGFSGQGTLSFKIRTVWDKLGWLVTLYQVKVFEQKYTPLSSCKCIIPSSKYKIFLIIALQLYSLRRRNPTLKLLVLKQGFSACGLRLSELSMTRGVQ